MFHYFIYSSNYLYLSFCRDMSVPCSEIIKSVTDLAGYVLQLVGLLSFSFNISIYCNNQSIFKFDFAV